MIQQGIHVDSSHQIPGPLSDIRKPDAWYDGETLLGPQASRREMPQPLDPGPH
jgi:hypothetical protein